MRRSIFRLAPLNFQNGQAPSHIPSSDFKSLVSLSETAPQNVVPGQHVVSVCKEHDIHFTNHMQGLKGYKQRQPPCGIYVNISRQHCMPWKAMRYFDKFEHPFAKSMLEFYIKKKKDPLWVHCSATGGSAFPNKKASRKLDHAVRDALKAAGYNRFGRRVLADGKSSATSGMYGSLSIMSFEAVAVCNAKFTDLLEEVTKIIATAEITLQRDADGRRLGDSLSSATDQRRRTPPSRGAQLSQRQDDGSRRGHEMERGGSNHRQSHDERQFQRGGRQAGRTERGSFRSLDLS